MCQAARSLSDGVPVERRRKVSERYGEAGRAAGDLGSMDRPSRESGSKVRSSWVGRATRGLYGSQIGSNMLRASVAEVAGSFILVFTGTAAATAALLNRATAGGPYDSLAVVLAFGLALAAVVAALGHVAGAHVNPAVTLGLAVTNNFPWRYVPAYVGAQLLGAILAALGTWIAYGDRAREVANLAATYPVGDVGDFRALIVEALVTFILVFVVVSVATDSRAPAAAAPIAVGFALSAGIFIAGPVTGGAVNPACALGPMIVSGNFTSAWVYIVGPVVGGILAAVLYDRFVREADAPGTDDPQ